MDHKYLYFDEAQLQKTRAVLKTRPEDPRYAAVCRHADVLLVQEFFSEEYANSVYNQHGRFYELGAQLVEMAETLGLLYAVEGRQDCADKLTAAMRHYASFAAWVGPSNKDRETPWKSELSTTRLVYGMAVGLDYLHDRFTEEDKRFFAEAMCRLAIRPLLEDWMLPGSRIHALDSMGHNWWSVCIALAGVGLCVIRDYVPEYAAWMPQILGALREFCAYPGSVMFNKIPNFDQQYFFYESIRYFNYGVGELLRFEYIWNRLAPAGETVTFLPHDALAAAFLTLSYPTKERLCWVNFGDSADGDTLVQLPCYLLLGGALTADKRQLLRQCYQQSVGIPTGTDLVYEAVLWTEEPSVPMALPTTTVLEGSGCGCHRRSWEADSTLFAVRCGYTWNHAHDDAGSFVLYDRGRPLLIDSGTCPYGDPLYHAYYTAGAGHSIVTADELGQPADNTYLGSKFPGTLTRLNAAPGTEIWRADATGPLSNTYQRNYRHFLLLDPDVTVILDDLRAYVPHRFRWQLHYQGEATVPAPGVLHIDNGVSRIAVHTVSPADSRMEFRDGRREQLNDPALLGTQAYVERVTLPEQTYVCVEYPEDTRVAHFLHVLLLNDAMEATVESLSGTDWQGARIRRGEDTFAVYYNLRADGRNMHVNSNNSLDGFETDAYLLAMHRKADGSTRWHMVSGSYLRCDGRSLHESFTKQDTFGDM